MVWRATVEVGANRPVLLNVLYSAESAPIMIFRVPGSPSFTSPKLYFYLVVRDNVC